MGFDMVERYTLGIKEALQCADLIPHHRCQFLWRHFDLASSEALDVWQAGMSADFDVVAFAGADGFLHDEWVAGVEAASYLRGNISIESCWFGGLG